MGATTGAALAGDEHLAQSIAQVLTTPLGTRVMRRDFGSLLPELVDQPFNAATQVALFGATAMALMRWEPRIRLSRIQITPGAAAGVFELTLEGRRTDAPAATSHTRLTIPLRLN